LWYVRYRTVEYIKKSKTRRLLYLKTHHHPSPVTSPVHFRSAAFNGTPPAWLMASFIRYSLLTTFTSPELVRVGLFTMFLRLFDFFSSVRPEETKIEAGTCPVPFYISPINGFMSERLIQIQVSRAKKRDKNKQTNKQTYIHTNKTNKRDT